MAVGNLRTEGDLRRFVQSELRRPGSLPAAKPAIALMKSGVPSDGDFPNPPGDGILALDTSGPTLYARVGGAWVAI
jgi:hypothetical protein